MIGPRHSNSINSPFHLFIYLVTHDSSILCNSTDYQILPIPENNFLSTTNHERKHKFDKSWLFFDYLSSSKWFSLFFSSMCIVSRFKMEMKMYLKCVRCWHLILEGSKLWISRQMLNICTTFIRNDIFKVDAQSLEPLWIFSHQVCVPSI